MSQQYHTHATVYPAIITHVVMWLKQCLTLPQSSPDLAIPRSRAKASSQTLAVVAEFVRISEGETWGNDGNHPGTVNVVYHQLTIWEWCLPTVMTLGMLHSIVFTY